MCRVDVSLIQRLRTARAWTVDRLADEASLDRRTIARIEKGTANEYEPRLATAAAIAKALEVDLSEIVLDGRPSAAGPEHEDRIVAAFSAADKAIRMALSEGGEWGAREASAVLSLLSARFESSFADYSDTAEKKDVDLVRPASEKARRKKKMT